MINSNAILEIHIKKLIKNYHSISNFSNKSITGATIKTNAYGLGDEEIFKILYKNGCRHFFLATLEEALKIRKKNSKGFLYVLNGLENNDIKIFHKYKIIPILISIEELKKYIKQKHYNKKIKIGLQIDTGLNRLGVSCEELTIKLKKKIDLHILISHFASADELSNNFSQIQNIKFQSSFKYFKSIKYKSIANSAGILRNKNYHYDITRPGISLYGGYENIYLKKIINIRAVIKLKAKVLQIKKIKKNEFVGYNQTYKTKSNKTLAIIGIGYGDGVNRLLSNNGNVYYKEQLFKIIGKVSMDSIIIDITKTKNTINVGDYFEIINNKYDIEKIANKCDTISREILTSITSRVKRIYL